MYSNKFEGINKFMLKINIIRIEAENESKKKKIYFTI